MLAVAMLTVIISADVMLTVVMLSVIKLTVIQLTVDRSLFIFLILYERFFSWLTVRPTFRHRSTKQTVEPKDHKAFTKCRAFGVDHY